MSQLTRRTFLGRASAGAATLGVLSTAPGLAAGTQAANAAAAEHTAAALHEPLVAHVLDAASGEISLLIGEREIVIHDRDLVARLVRAAR